MTTTSRPALFPDPPSRPNRDDFGLADNASATADYHSAILNWADNLMPAWIAIVKAILEKNGIEPIDLEDGHGLPADESRASFPGAIPGRDPTP